MDTGVQASPSGGDGWKRVGKERSRNKGHWRVSGLQLGLWVVDGSCFKKGKGEGKATYPTKLVCKYLLLFELFPLVNP